MAGWWFGLFVQSVAFFPSLHILHEIRYFGWPSPDLGWKYQSGFDLVESYLSRRFTKITSLARLSLHWPCRQVWQLLVTEFLQKNTDMRREINLLLGAWACNVAEDYVQKNALIGSNWTLKSQVSTGIHFTCRIARQNCWLRQLTMHLERTCGFMNVSSLSPRGILES